MQHISNIIQSNLNKFEKMRKNRARTINESKTPLKPLEDEYRGKNGWLYCKKCGGRRSCAGATKDEVRERCKCQIEKEEKEKRIQAQTEKQKRIEKLIKMSLLGSRYTDVSFNNTKSTNNSFNVAFNRCKKYCEVADIVLAKGLGIYLFGDKGTGKTRLTACMANYLMANYYTTLFTNFSEISKEIRSSFKNKTNSEDKILNNISKVNFLFIDDLGVERVLKDSQDLWIQEKMYEIINNRYNNKSPVIYTSNFSLRELIEIRGVDDRTVDRIMETTVQIKIEGTSYRATSRAKTDLPF